MATYDWSAPSDGLEPFASDEVSSNFIKESVLRKAPGMETVLKRFKTVEHVRPMHTLSG